MPEKRPHVTELHGEQRVDEYHWLRDLSDPRVRAHLDAENNYAAEMLSGTRDLQALLFDEMRARFKESDVSAPHRLDDYLYYYRTARDAQYPIHCRRHGEAADEEVIFDLNTISAATGYFGLGAFRVSPNHGLLAYSVDAVGDESFTVYVKDLATGHLLSDTMAGTFGGVEWSSDGRTILYTAIDSSSRPFELRAHTIGDEQGNDAVVYREEDRAFNLSIGKSKTRRFLILSSESLTTSEVTILDAADPLAPALLVEPRAQDVEYSVDHQGDRFIVLSDEGTGVFRLFEAPEHSPSRSNWSPLPHDHELLIEEFEVFREHIVAVGRRDGLPQALVMDRDGSTHYLDFPEASYTVDAVGTPEFETALFRLRYTSLVTPHSIYDYDMRNRQMHLVKQLEIASGYDQNLYRSDRVFATSKDGTKVPVSVVYRRDLVLKDGTAPCLLNGYGAYGDPNDAEFVPERLTILDRGFIYAIAHVRGGGEYGEAWHDDGRLLAKPNSFDDFIACAEYLIEEGFTSAQGLVIDGRSAGGLLVAAAANMRPDLFRAVVADVPFVDVLNTMLDESLPLTVAEFEEWGDPREAEAHECIRSYSPYDRIGAKPYPTMLVSASLNDARVPYWEPVKWAAKLRDLSSAGYPVILRVLPAGHTGISGRLDYIREEALAQGWLLRLFHLA